MVQPHGPCFFLICFLTLSHAAIKIFDLKPSPTTHGIPIRRVKTTNHVVLVAQRPQDDDRLSSTEEDDGSITIKPSTLLFFDCVSGELTVKPHRLSAVLAFLGPEKLEQVLVKYATQTSTVKLAEDDILHIIEASDEVQLESRIFDSMRGKKHFTSTLVKIVKGELLPRKGGDQEKVEKVKKVAKPAEKKDRKMPLPSIEDHVANVESMGKLGKKPQGARRKAPLVFNDSAEDWKEQEHVVFGTEFPVMHNGMERQRGGFVKKGKDTYAYSSNRVLGILIGPDQYTILRPRSKVLAPQSDNYFLILVPANKKDLERHVYNLSLLAAAFQRRTNVAEKDVCSLIDIVTRFASQVSYRIVLPPKIFDRVSTPLCRSIMPRLRVIIGLESLGFEQDIRRKVGLEAGSYDKSLYTAVTSLPSEYNTISHSVRNEILKLAVHSYKLRKKIKDIVMKAIQLDPEFPYDAPDLKEVPSSMIYVTPQNNLKRALSAFAGFEFSENMSLAQCIKKAGELYVANQKVLKELEELQRLNK